MTDLATLAPALKRAIAPPGAFDSVFPAAGPDDLIGYLLDGIAEAQLDGFLLRPMVTFDQHGLVTPDLSPGEQALVLLYSGMRMLRATLLTRSAGSVRYKAGETEYETNVGVSVLVALLREAQDRRDKILARLQQLEASRSFGMADQYLLRATGGYGAVIAGVADAGYQMIGPGYDGDWSP
jgi:hypothetical protein